MINIPKDENGKLFIMLGGETHNSACTSREYMKNVWDKAEALHCNTVLAPVYWELLEQKEGVYEFTMVEELIEDARLHGMKLVLLWFGAWKNGCSTYVPGWVKQNQLRFPRVLDENKKPLKILSMFDSEIGAVEKKTFCKFMSFLKAFDLESHTVLAVQVENEIGVLDAAMDYSLGAKRAYRDEPEEVFMATHYAKYLNRLAKAGKAIYDLPMYTNVWLREESTEKPGTFPSGGPIPEVIDVWKKHAPCIDFIAPDIYTFKFDKVAEAYTRPDNPLFIPETRRDKWAVANLYKAIGKYQAICFSPFGLESIGEDKSFITQKLHTNASDKNVSSKMIQDYLADSYQMLSNMMPMITSYYGTQYMTGFCQDEGQMTSHIILGDYRIRIEYYHGIDDNNEFIPGAGMAFLGAQGENSGFELIFIGYGYRAYVEPLNNLERIDFLTLEKGYFTEEAQWIQTMYLNGDEQHIQMEEIPTAVRASFYKY